MTEEEIAMDSNFMEICCACLSTELLERLTPSATLAYQNLTGVALTEDLASKICLSCDKLLNDTDVFRAVCLQSFKWLVESREKRMKKYNEINEENTDEEYINLSSKSATDDSVDLLSIHSDIDIIYKTDIDIVEEPVKDNSIEKDSNVEFINMENAEFNNSDPISKDDDADVLTDNNNDCLDDVTADNEDVTDKITVNNESNKPTNVVKEEKIQKGKKKTKKKANKEDEVNDDMLENYFEIKTLSKKEQIKQFMKKKDLKMYKNAKFKCDDCYSGFIVEESFKNHMVKHTEKFGTYTCDICKTHCMSNIQMSRHNSSRHKRIFSCKNCEFTASDRSRAKLHMFWHNGKTYTCEKCSKVFRRKQILFWHSRTYHPDSGYVCNYCNLSYNNDNGLKLHIKLKHHNGDIPPEAEGPKCDECKITFANDDALSEHKTTAKKHVKVKKTKKRPEREPMECEQCGEVSASWRAHRMHFNLKHSNSTLTKYPEETDPHLCFVCGMTFISLNSLYLHQQKHEGKQYECDVCKKNYDTPKSFRRHQKLHTEKPEFTCDICSRVFNNYSNRIRHMTYVHTTLRTQKCDFCEKTFKSRPEKKLHQDYVHLKKPYKKRNRGKTVATEALSESNNNSDSE